jgi:hypothetical protein
VGFASGNRGANDALRQRFALLPGNALVDQSGGRASVQSLALRRVQVASRVTFLLINTYLITRVTSPR